VCYFRTLLIITRPKSAGKDLRIRLMRPMYSWRVSREVETVLRFSTSQDITKQINGLGHRQGMQTEHCAYRNQAP